MNNKVVFIDTNSIGNFHEVFNAAFFKILETNFDTVLHVSSKSSFETIKRILSSNEIKFDASKIKFKEVKVLEGMKSHEIFLRKIFASIFLFFLLFKYRKNSIVLANLNEFGTIYYNFLAKAFKINLTIVTHGELEYLIQDVPKKKPIFIYKKLLLRFFTRKWNDRIKIIMLGNSIQKKMQTLFPLNATSFVSMNHPYFFKNLEPHFTKKPIRMGIVGAVGENKGVLSFFQLSEKLKDFITSQQLELYVVGKHGYNPIDFPLIKFVGETNQIIPTQEYNQAIQQLDAILFFYGADQYQLTASGAIFDAVNHEKPIIAIENSYFKHVFSYGNIGFLGKNISEIEEVIKKIILNEDILKEMNTFKNVKFAFSWENITFPLKVNN